MAEIVYMPKLSDTMTEGVVASWLKKVGDTVKNGEIIAEIETDKATMEFESFQDGVILHIGVHEGKGAPVDSILAILGKGGEDVAAIIEAEKNKSAEPVKEEVKVVSENKSTAPVATKTTVTVASQSANGERMKISPLAKKLAEDKGISVSALKGSGDNGRIIKRDIDNFKSLIFFVFIKNVPLIFR